jgi:hypothetical protein
MLALHTLILVSVGVLVVCVVVGLAAVGARGLTLWRAIRRFRRALVRDLPRVSAQMARLEQDLAEAAGASVRVDQARARLQASLADATALARAANEAKELVDRVRALRPTK